MKINTITTQYAHFILIHKRESKNNNLSQTSKTHLRQTKTRKTLEHNPKMSIPYCTQKLDNPPHIPLIHHKTLNCFNDGTNRCRSSINNCLSIGHWIILHFLHVLTWQSYAIFIHIHSTEFTKNWNWTRLIWNQHALPTTRELNDMVSHTPQPPLRPTPSTLK